MLTHPSPQTEAPPSANSNTLPSTLPAACPGATALSADMETAVGALAGGHWIAHQALHWVLLRMVTDKQRKQHTS